MWAPELELCQTFMILIKPECESYQQEERGDMWQGGRRSRQACRHFAHFLNTMRNGLLSYIGVIESKHTASSLGTQPEDKP